MKATPRRFQPMKAVVHTSRPAPVSFDLRIVAEPDRLNREPAQRLRGALKRLRRDYGLRAVEVREVKS